MNESLPADTVFKRMAAYASDLERTSPPVFVGRQAELAMITLSSFLKRQTTAAS